jgi:chromosome segregation ATPase
MTKISKVLTILTAFMAVAFMGFTASSFYTQFNWKAKKAEIEAKIPPQREELNRLDTEITRYEGRLTEAKAAIEADLKAIEARRKYLQAQLDDLAKKSSEASTQIAEATRKATQVRDEAKLRREEGLQLANQLAELRSQKSAADEQKRKLTDLLVQARGVLERAERRAATLERDGATAPPYEEPAAEPAVN